MRTRLFVHHLLSLLISVSLLLTPAAPTVQARSVPDDTAAPAAQRPAAPDSFGLFRTRIVVDSPARRQRLDELGIVVLEETADDGQETDDRGQPTASQSDAVSGPWSAVVLADDEQLETLARLRYQPQATDEFVSLVEANTAENSWLAAGLAPLLAVGRTGSPTYAARALTPEQRAALADLTSLDDDADGLTNAQESWWCTDPLNADSDGDGSSDGAEVQAAKDWLGNRRAGPPSTGRPFAGWPPATFDTTRPPTCRDGDADGVPDMAERWELGLNMNAESTDRDKFDDGQELFGTTEWGRGALPRVTDDAGYIFAEMPTWVEAPGNHPFVAAFPAPEIDVVASSLKVETVTTVTTDHVISSGTEKSYSTAKTEGTSTSLADTETWSNWQEVTVSRTDPARKATRGSNATGNWFTNLFKGEAEFDASAQAQGQVGGAAAGCGLSLACAAGSINNQIQAQIGQVETNLEGSLVKLKDVTANINLSGLKDSFNNWITNAKILSDNNICIGGCTINAEPSGDPLYSILNQQSDTQDRIFSGSSFKVNVDSGGNATNVSYQKLLPLLLQRIPNPSLSTVTNSQTKGSSVGGARTTTNTQYEEHTVTNGEAFSNGESWGNATAADTAHSADLWFTYKVRNTGTEYARQIGNLAFNLYIGDSPDPATTYFVAPDLGGSGIFQNFMPNEEHQYTSRRIPLSLEQMKAIDLGGPLRVVVEDFTYGIDEDFFAHASGGGVMIALEDGTDDGDERIDSYLLPTWGEESVVDVLARYFPHTADENGTVIAIWTPEYRADTPAWCAEPKIVGIGGQRTLWCKHALSSADWWNVYTNGLGDGSEGFQDTPASPGAVALFRFNSDTDLDGYSDRSEQRMGTDPNDASDFPRPELLAGLHSIRNGNSVTATASLLNSGPYDAYGVELVMIASDDSVSITNNTVGGSGRVRAQKQVIVGSRIALQTPLPAAWTQAGHAVPAAGGYYTGGQDRMYTFTVQCGTTGGCSVSSEQLSVAWSDGAGNSGTLDFGAGYASPTFLPVGALGLTLALHSGTVANGESFTVDARTPRDTFQYTINREPFSAPLVIVSYNDPQGNHRFIIPPAAVSLTTPSDNLAPFSGQMLDDVGVEIVTTEEYTGGPTSTRLLVNNPSETTVTDAHVFLEFINISGTVVSEVSTQVTLPPGPTTAEVAWDSAAFDPAYNPAEDYIVMAFLTDYQGNILDTAGRPLSSFQDDPRPAAALDNGAQVWDFGAAQQGTLIEHPFALASVGYLDLLAYLGNAPGLSVDGPAATSISPGDVALYTVQLNTESLAVGVYEATIPVRTSDPQNPSASLTIRGTITPMPGDAPGGAVLRPLDVDAAIAGDHTAGEWVTFSHSLGPDAASLHPVKVYSQDYGTLHGVGKYATDFGAGTASYDMFGDGRDGDLAVNSGQTMTFNTTRANVVASGTTAMPNNNSVGFTAGDLVFFHQSQLGSDVGRWEFNTIISINSPTNWTLAKPLQYAYGSAGTTAQVLKVPQYRNVTVNSGGTLTAPAWAGANGGIVVFRANGAVTVDGQINVTGKGFRGGNGAGSYPNTYGVQGESDLGTGIGNNAANGSGGGAGYNGGGGGGGGFGAIGTGGQNRDIPSGGNGGSGGNTDGNVLLTDMVFGGGGGGGGGHTGPGGRGGAGGGIVHIYAANILVQGSIVSSGEVGAPKVNDVGGGGGGGAGGAIHIQTQTGSFGANSITAPGAGGGAGFGGSYPSASGYGGVGGAGRIRIEYCNTLSGSTNPPASTQKLNCYIAEQVESTPYNTARINLPETFSGGRTYKVQYGRRLSFPTPATVTTTIRLPKQLYSDATLDALVNNTGVASGPLALSVDFGNDGAADWNHNATTTFPATLNVTGTVSALNAWLVSRTDVAWGAEVDVPVRVVSDRAADLLLTALVLRLQVNQPTARAGDVEIAADRPLDWPLQVAGNYSQGAQYDFTHSLGPDPATLHPCAVYDQSGNVLKGVGKYCTDLGAGTASYEMFGDGRDGVMPGSGNLDNANGFAAGSVNGTAGATSISVTDRYAIARVNPGDAVLIHQTRGSGAGQWELNKAVADFTGTGTFTLQKPLKYAYVSNGGNEKAQVLRVPQYSTCNVTGTVTPLAGWNGDWGGIFAVMCLQNMYVTGTINAIGSVGTTGPTPGIGIGFPGGTGVVAYGSTAHAGEGTSGPAVIQQAANGTGGGGAVSTGTFQSGGNGGGGGHATAGGAGTSSPVGGSGGAGGGLSGTADLAVMTFGGGGGGSSGADLGATGGGAGGGIIFLAGTTMTMGPAGSITANGGGGGQSASAGGSGAGGSILIKTQTATLGSSQLTAMGAPATPGTAVGGAFVGGAGGTGRIRIEYCDTLIGTTNPPASTQKLNCYAAEQLPTTPYTTTRLYLPDAVSGSRSYLVQYARRFVFAAPGQQTSSLRLNRRVYGGASLDLLVSNAGATSGDLNLCLDLGNDGVCDYNHSGSTNFPATLEADGLAEALNNYLLGRTDIAWGEPVDVHVRLTLDRQADVMLTNLALTPLGAKTRFVRLEARTYSTATLGLEFRQPGVSSGPLAFTVDVGADGSVDWSYAGTPTFPALLTSPNLATALNAYLSAVGSPSSAVDVPIRIVPSPFLELSLIDFDADPADRPDLVPLSPTAGAARNGEPIVEGDTVPLTAVIQNNGPADSGPIAVTFYAIRDPSTGSGQATQYFYIGADFISNISRLGEETASIPWNTLGFPGDTTVRAVVDPFNRTRESDEGNNSAEAVIPIRTRPDLRVTAIELSNSLLMAGETVTVTLTLSNTGQTAAGSQTVALFDANPDSGGGSLGALLAAPVAGETDTTIQFQWTPTAPGPYRLFSLSDLNGQVVESDEGNNRAWQDVYVGLAAPVLLDSGPGEPVYSPAQGYGVVDEGQADVFVTCGSGSTPEETQRLDFDGRLVYRFDHLLPGRFYHLDITLYECTGAGRQESIYIDGNLVDGPINLGDGEVHRRSLLLDPALYADHSVEVSIEVAGVNGALVSAVNLHAVDYRYADAGGTNDPDYSPALGYGALNGTRSAAWGSLPYRSVRVNQTGRTITYRYDNLIPGRNYQLHLSFYQSGDNNRVQQVEIDGKLAGAELTLVNDRKQRVTLPVPPESYAGDGSIGVSVVRTNADVGAIVNEIALEEQTIPTVACSARNTPYWTQAYGSVTIAGQPAPPGTVVTAENPDGVIVGCFQVGLTGFYGFMPIFGASNPIPGMAAGQQVKFRVDGSLAVAAPSLVWQNDKEIQRIDLTVTGIDSQWIRLNPGWTLFSLRVQPPVTSLDSVLNSIQGAYCHVHGETDIYDCNLPSQSQGLTELRGATAYYLRNESSATVNLLVQGTPITPTQPIPLHTDWNWVGYLLQQSAPVGDALASIAGKYSRAVDGKARLYNPTLPQFSTLTHLTPDDGYLIFATELATLVYPAVEAAATGPLAVREVCNDVSPTPAFTWLYGELRVNGQPAALGSRVDVLTPRGELAGCALVDTVGLYGFLPVYGADRGNPPLPGFVNGEAMTLRVNGQEVALSEPLLWRNDKQERRVDLSVTIEERRFFLPLIGSPPQARSADADADRPLYLPLMGR